MLSYFNNYINDFGHSYSCDMIRLKFEYKKENEFDMLHFLNSNIMMLDMDVDIKYYQSFRPSDFRHFFVISQIYKVFDTPIEYSFKIGVLHNCDTDKDSLKGFIEFNPNKCNLSVVTEYMKIIKEFSNNLGYGLHFELVRYDLAIDIKVPKTMIKLIKEGKRTYQYIQSKTVTEYLGIKHTDGYTKLYDKREEAGLDYDLARLEITCTSLDKVALPRVSLVDCQFSLDMDLTKTDAVLVSLIRQQPEHEQQYYLGQLGKTKRDKLRPYINGESAILQYDRKGILHVQDIVKDAMRIIF